MRYRMRPFEVEAWQHIKERKDASVTLPGWVLTAILDGRLAIEGGNIRVQTAKGTVVAEDKDWIVREESGELRPYKPDVFAFRYEPLPETRE